MLDRKHLDMKKCLSERVNGTCLSTKVFFKNQSIYTVTDDPQ